MIPGQESGARSVLTAAALTYVASDSYPCSIWRSSSVSGATDVEVSGRGSVDMKGGAAALVTPLFAAVLLVFLGTMAWTGAGINIEREILIAFDLLLVLVLALLLYTISARDPQSGPGAFDVVQVVLIASALAADAVALQAIGARISEFGFTPNRVAALGMNVILFVNLAWSAVLNVRFLRGRGTFPAIERWQTGYMPVYAAWAAIVVVAFPVLFGYL